MHKALSLLHAHPSPDEEIKNMIAEIQDCLKKAIQNDAEYASMIRCAVRNQFRF